MFSSAAAIALAVALVAVVLADAPPRPGSQAPEISTPIVANGTGTIDLSALKGRPVYLNFFATWCRPCKAEVPEIAKLSVQFAKSGVIVVGVDELESRDKILLFVKRFKLPYRIVADEEGRIGGAYGLAGLPMHVFIGADGKVAAIRRGQMAANDIRAGLNSIAKRTALR